MMNEKGVMRATDFWDRLFSQGQEFGYSKIEMPDLNDPILRRALKHFGDVKNKTIIDLGCGRGATSLFLAHCGANVVSIDSSEIAINNLSEYCKKNSIGNITALHLSAQQIISLHKVDFVFGSMILHHIEPFGEFSELLRDVIKPGGKGFFWENNARSSAMIWFRQNVVGKFWVPKYGDPDEFPLMPSEVEELKKYFNVEIEYPELLYFRMISTYLFRGRLMRPFKMLDDFFFKFPKFRERSYRQYVLLS